MIQHDVENSKYKPTYWAEWSDRIITELSLKRLAKNEWHGSCPNCGGRDRFWITERVGEVKVHCRQCNDFKAITDAMRSRGIWPMPEERTTFEHRPAPIQWPDPEPNTHPYLAKKRIQMHNAVINGANLCIPIIDVNGQRVGIQTINAEGKKKFTAGMATKGNFSVIGGPITDKVFVCEGWATAASVFEATSIPTIFALASNNLADVVASIKAARPNAEVIIAADNDDAGVKAADDAKAQHGVAAYFPPAGMDFNDLWVAQGADAVKRALTPVRLSDSVFWADKAAPVLENNYLVKKWLGAGQMSCVYGQSNVGKSFFVLDMAYHIASDQEWHGNRVDGGCVLYLATEGGNAFRNRVFALNKHYQYQNPRLAIRPQPVDLFNEAADLPTIERLCNEISEEFGTIKMVVIDTLARAMQNGDENTAQDMSKFIANLDVLRDATDAHILIVHHSGKDASKGARGSSALRAALDTEIELELDDEEGVLRFAKTVKQRDMEGGGTFAFKLRVEVLGQDQDGDDVTTCTIEPVGGDEVKDATRKKLKGKNQLTMRDCYKQLRDDQIGGPNIGGLGWPEVGKFWTVPEDRLREHFCGKIDAANKPDTYKKTIESLIGNGHACRNEGQIWFLGKEGRT